MSQNFKEWAVWTDDAAQKHDLLHDGWRDALIQCLRANNWQMETFWCLPADHGQTETLWYANDGVDFRFRVGVLRDQDGFIAVQVRAVAFERDGSALPRTVQPDTVLLGSALIEPCPVVPDWVVR